MDPAARRPVLAGVVLGAVVVAAACAVPRRSMHDLPAAHALAPCRTPRGADGAAVDAVIRWVTPREAADRRRHDDACATLGVPLIVSAAPAPTSGNSPVGVLTWNVHDGAGDLAEMIRRLRTGRLTGGRPVERFVLLLQEARRANAARRPRRPNSRSRTRQGSAPEVDDVVAVARAFGLALYYVPTLAATASRFAGDDRGNAILATEPLTDFLVVELPFERQRRLAIEATMTSHDAAGRTWRLRVASVHLESTASSRRLRVLATESRVRQSQALLDALGPSDHRVIGGDFNTWFGYSDRTYRLLSTAFVDAVAADRRRTFLGLFRLDHLFARLPPDWVVGGSRVSDRLGSDHHPLLVTIDVPPSGER